MEGHFLFRALCTQGWPFVDLSTTCMKPQVTSWTLLQPTFGDTVDVHSFFLIYSTENIKLKTSEFFQPGLIALHFTCPGLGPPAGELPD